MPAFSPKIVEHEEPGPFEKLDAVLPEEPTLDQPL